MHLRLAAALLLVGAAVVAPAAAGAATAAPVTSGSEALAYTKDASATQPAQVWILRHGRKPLRIAKKGYAPVISPSGLLIAYAVPTDRGQLLRVATNTGKVVRTLSRTYVNGGGPNLVWFADDKRVATFTGPAGRRQRLVVISVATGKRHIVDSGYFSGLSLSPDQKRIVYGRTRDRGKQGLAGDLFVAPVSGGVAVNITKDGRSVTPFWSTSQIAYSHLSKGVGPAGHRRSNLALIQPGGGGRKALTDLKIPASRFGLSIVGFTTDGRRILAEYRGVDLSEAWTVDVATGQARDLTGKEDGVSALGLSARGDFVLAGTGGGDPRRKHRIVKIPFKGGHAKIVAKAASLGTWEGYF